MKLKTLKIGGLNLKNNVVLAPMAGYTNYPFRLMCLKLGASLCFSEMVSAKGLKYGNENTSVLLTTGKEEKIKAAQLFGADPEIMRFAAESEYLAPFDIIDINMGCPMPKIYNNGEGSALLNNPLLAEKIISECKKSGKLITVKMRIGVDENNIVAEEFAKMAEGAGADMITVHGRTKNKIYAGEVNFKEIERVKKAVKIPVIANGGVFFAKDADRLINETGADGVAVARGALYDPRIFCDIVGEARPDFKKLYMDELDLTQKLFGEKFAVVFMRKMCAFYVKGMRGANALKEKLFRTQTAEELKETVNSITFD